MYAETCSETEGEGTAWVTSVNVSEHKKKRVRVQLGSLQWMLVNTNRKGWGYNLSHFSECKWTQTERTESSHPALWPSANKNLLSYWVEKGTLCVKTSTVVLSHSPCKNSWRYNYSSSWTRT
jgi:hypothetical protein